MKERQICAVPLHRYIAGKDRSPLLILLACVGAVLLIACANVANLQLARTVARQHEMALRGALGAGRLRLIRQSLVESLTLAAMAGALGLAIAGASTWLIRRSGTPGTFPSASDTRALLQAPLGKMSAAVRLSGWVLAFTAGLALLTTILFGLAPAFGASRTDLRSALQGSARRISSGRQQRRARSVLLMAEIGLAVLLLTGAGLLMRSFANVLRDGSGFNPRQCLTAMMQRNYSRKALEIVPGFVQRLMPRLQALPGVQAAAVTSALPLQEIGPNTAILPGDGGLPARNEWPISCAISISPGYFRAADTIVLRGRRFNNDDVQGSTPVAIVNHAFAQRYFNGDALGGAVRTNINGESATDLTRRTIVGVVDDIRYNGPEGNIEPVIYLPITQVPQLSLRVLLRSTVDPASLSSAVRRTVTQIDPDQPTFDMQTMEERISEMLAQRRLMMMLIALFAGLALLLAGVGIYGVFAYWVNQRRPEMGIRLALGSSRCELLRLVVMQAVRLTLLGGGVGLTGAWFLDRLLASMLVGVKAHDPVSFSLAWVLMTLIALLGSSLPAVNAARTDLVSVLHSEQQWQRGCSVRRIGLRYRSCAWRCRLLPRTHRARSGSGCER